MSSLRGLLRFSAFGWLLAADRIAPVLRVAALLAIVAALSGCGGGGHQFDNSQVTSVTHRYFTAVANGNGSEACALLSDAAKLSLHHGVNAVEPNTYKPVTLTCPQEIKIVHTALSPEALLRLRNVALGAPTISGEGATLRAVTGSRATNVLLSKTAGGWRIDTLGLYGSTTPRPALFSSARIEGVAALEGQLAAGEVQAATFDKRVRSARLALTRGRHVLMKYGKGEEPKVVAQLQAKGVRVTVLTQAQAEREAATFRGE
jgi:hypothetical protein